MSMRRVPSDGVLSNTLEEKRSNLHRNNARALSAKDVDTAAQIVAGLSIDLDPTEAARVRKKIDRHILPIMCILYCIQFMDKATLGSSAILGIDKSAHLSTYEYNWLGTIFFISYLLFEYPQNLALQRFPVGRWMSFNIIVWAISLICQAACTNFAGLFVCRFILGMCEGSVTAGFMIVNSMFYTRNEQTVRVGYWFLMNGISQLISGFISFGTLHIRTRGFAPWQWLVVICGTLTLVVGIIYWFFFPDSPTNAWFLTPRERVTAIQRLKENQTGVENKHFKKEQMMEALLDPKTWLFALYSSLGNVPSLSIQRQIIVSSFGFTRMETTLITGVEGIIAIMAIWTGVTLAARIPNSRAYVAVLYVIPSYIGILMIQLLPWKDKVGLLASVWLFAINGTGFVIALSWLNNVTAGHTKRVTTNAIMLGASCIGNATGPFMWKAKYKPRNRVPWIIIGIIHVVCPLLLLVIRWLLARENARRDAEPVKDDEEFFIEKELDDGKVVRVNVDKEFVDLTDRQNRDFRYVL